jgi:hypothetical protein
MHGLLDWEVAEIIGLFDEWGEVDRSHRKLAHRGSYLERVWVSPASVYRVLEREGLRLRPLPRPGRSVRKPFPDWAEYRPGSIWIYDTTLWGAETRLRAVSRRFVPSLDALHALADRPPPHPPAREGCANSEVSCDLLVRVGRQLGTLRHLSTPRRLPWCYRSSRT